MTTETKPESPVPESAYADYEQDLLNDDVPPAQARATRRALERIVDRLMLSLATKAELEHVRTDIRSEMAGLRSEIADLREQLAHLRESRKHRS